MRPVTYTVMVALALFFHPWHGALPKIAVLVTSLVVVALSERLITSARTRRAARRKHREGRSVLNIDLRGIALAEVDADGKIHTTNDLFCRYAGIGSLTSDLAWADVCATPLKAVLQRPDGIDVRMNRRPVTVQVVELGAGRYRLEVLDRTEVANLTVEHDLLHHRMREMYDITQVRARNERQLIAAALHNDAVQMLATLRLELHLEGVDAGVLGRVDSSISAIRGVIGSLSPAHVPIVDLLASVRHLGERMESDGITHILIDSQGEPIPADMDLMFRITQELMTNSHKHGRARLIQIMFRFEPDASEVVVIDNGTGFDTENVGGAESGHVGLSLVREIVRSRDGVMTVSSERWSGTNVRAFLPSLTRREQ